MSPRWALGVAGSAAAVLAVGIDVQLFDRFSTYVVDGDLVARSTPELVAIGALGPLAGLALLAAVAALLAPAGGRGRLVRTACQALLAAGGAALAVGVATAAAMRFSLSARPAVVAVTVGAFAVVYALMVRRVRA